MRILQIIDSLEAGGSERMAVNYANSLVHEIEFSGLIVTRKEGPLKEQIDSSVSYLFLAKKKQLDIKALFRLRSYILKNKVTHIHAHSTSFFIAFLLKIIYPSINLIWHLHYGGSEFLPKKRVLLLRIILFNFNGTIAVNKNLKIWAEEKLHLKNVVYLPNFPVKQDNNLGKTILKGTEGKRIVSLANLRIEKNHFLLLEVAKKLKQSHSDWSFHLIGKDFKDQYSKEIHEAIEKDKLENNVFIYDSRQDIDNILIQADITVLTSKFEGLPVALLEYGQAKKPVVATGVGEIPFVIQDRRNGLVVPNLNKEAFYNSIVTYIESKELREDLGNQLFKTISEKFSEKVIMRKYLNWLQTS